MENRINELEESLASIFRLINNAFALITVFLGFLMYIIFDMLRMNREEISWIVDILEKHSNIISTLSQKSSGIVNVTDTVGAIQQGLTNLSVLLFVFLGMALLGIPYLFINIGKKMERLKHD